MSRDDKGRNPYQAVTAKVYACGDYEHMSYKLAKRYQGDTLFQFIMRELDDVATAEEAIQRLDMAITDLENLRDAIVAKLEEPHAYTP